MLAQTRESKQDIYSVHASTSQANWIVGTRAMHGNLYDGHTLSVAMEQLARLTKRELKDVMVDQGSRDHSYTGSAVLR